MAAIAPFRALRYNLDRAGALAEVVAPPYDVLSPREQDALHERSPYNVIRLILGKEQSSDTPSDNRYTRARRTLDAWREEGILRRDEAPAIYLYEHTFQWEGKGLRRLGFVALLEFDGSVPGRVLSHEATFEAPKADRARLLDAVRANLSPIFCIVPDSTRRLLTQLEGLATTRPPLGSARVGADEMIRLWAVSDPETIRAIQQQVEPTTVLIADGHHRFAVALANRHLARGVMTYFASSDDPALLIRPIHRVLHLTPEQQAGWKERLERLFRITAGGSLGQVKQWLASSDGQGRFGGYAGGALYQVSIREEALAEWLLHPTVSGGIAGLDVTVLHHVLLPRWLGVVPEAVPLCRYTADAAEAVAMAQAAPGGCAWLLRPIPLGQIVALVAQGLALPQKSTYFYPKVFAGLVINPFDAQSKAVLR